MYPRSKALGVLCNFTELLEDGIAQQYVSVASFVVGGMEQEFTIVDLAENDRILTVLLITLMDHMKANPLKIMRDDEAALDYFKNSSGKEQIEIIQEECKNDRDMLATCLLQFGDMFEKNERNISFFNFGAELLRVPNAIQLLEAKSTIYNELKSVGAMVFIKHTLGI